MSEYVTFSNDESSTPAITSLCILRLSGMGPYSIEYVSKPNGVLLTVHSI